MIISMVPRERVPEIYELVRKMLQPAIDAAHGRMEWNSVLAELGTGKTTLWAIAEDDGTIKAFAVFRIFDYPLVRALTVELLGGKGFREHWGAEFVEVINSYAKEYNCGTIEAIGRKGWRRVLGDHGFKEIAVTFERPVE